MVISTISGLYKPKTGDRSRFYNLTKQLAKYNKLIILIPKRVKDTRDCKLGEVIYYNEDIRKKSFGVFTDINPFFIIKLIKILKNNKIDVIQISHPYGIIITRFIIKILRKNAFLIYDAHNVDSDSIKAIKYYLRERISFKRKAIIFLKTILVQIIESIAVNIVDRILAVSEKDKKRFIFKFKLNQKNIMVIPSGATIIKDVNDKKTDSFNQLNSNKNFKIFFHGYYNHAPNKEAIKLIKEYISPNISKIIENSKIILAGTEVPCFKEKKIQSFGFVDNMNSLLNLVDIAIVPIRSGGGTKLKVLEYMAAGLPVVTTKKGIEGINVKNGKHAMIFDEVNEEFIEGINYLYKNPDKRKKIGLNAKKLVIDEYDWNKIGTNLNEYYNKL